MNGRGPLRTLAGLELRHLIRWRQCFAGDSLYVHLHVGIRNSESYGVQLRSPVTSLGLIVMYHCCCPISDDDGKALA